MSAALVTSPEQLAEVCGALCGRIALDTEFHAERRHAPELYLVQLHQPGRGTWIVDVPAVRQLEPLGPALSACELLLHGGERDLQLLVDRAALAPGAVVDTQVLAGCLGLGYPRRLEDLRAEVLGRPRDGARRGLTNWSRRPLTDEQLAYAATDVADLPALVDALVAGATPDRVRLARAVTGDLVERWLAPEDPSLLWRRFPAARVMSLAERQRLRHLAAWRAEQARVRNLAPWNIASDRVLVDIARRAPGSVAALAANRLTPRGLVKRHGETLVDLVRGAPAVPLAPLADDPTGRAAQALLQAWAFGLEDREGVAAGLVLPPERLDDLLQRWLVDRSVPTLPAWLEALAGAELRALLAGESALRLHPRTGTLMPSSENS